MTDGICISLSDLSPNPNDHAKFIDDLKVNQSQELSFQNALNVINLWRIINIKKYIFKKSLNTNKLIIKYFKDS